MDDPMTPEFWGIVGTLALAVSAWGKILLDQRGKKLDATLTDSGKRREEWYIQAEKLQARLDAMDTAYKTRIDAMDAAHKAEVRDLQTQLGKAREDHYDMVKIQLHMSVQQSLQDEHIRELQTVVRRLDEHIVDLYVSIQQEPEAGPRILGRLKTARPAVLLRDMHITKGDPNE